MQTIKDEELCPLIQYDLKDFVSLSSAMTNLAAEEIPRPLIGRMLLEASKCEEMLDAYGAARNEYWSPFRKAVATTKAFCRVIYNLFHIYLYSSSYNLLEIEGDFHLATKETINSLLHSIATGAENSMKIAKKIDIDKDIRPLNSYGFRDLPVTVKLRENQKKKVMEDPEDTAIYLATNFLNHAGQSSFLDVYKKLKPSEYHSCIPETIGEEKIRLLANNFHSLQSLYDTYLSGTDIAEKDAKLPVLRGNITVVFHLLDTAVTLIHYYERHVNKSRIKKIKTPISNTCLLDIIIGYFVTYSDRYIKATQNLCREILKSYSVQGSIEVPIPNYRGFHVRPSTLISKIVIHYGSDVKMFLGKTVYNASLPLELFRANEELNRKKREAVANCVMKHKLIKDDEAAVFEVNLMKKILRMVFLDLLEENEIMLYDNNFSFEDLAPLADETISEFIKRAIALYLATGKIDIVSGEVVVFKGDIRVLEDIRTLAENGYGEDQYGNNIVLPAKLSYIQR